MVVGHGILLYISPSPHPQVANAGIVKAGDFLEMSEKVGRRTNGRGYA